MSGFKSVDLKMLCTVYMFFNVYYIFKTLVQFNAFLSQPLNIHSANISLNGTVQSVIIDLNSSNWFHPLATNIILIEIFYIQHSLLRKSVEHMLRYFGIDFLGRSVFNLLSATAIQILMHFWCHTTSWAIWHVDIVANSWSDWTIWSVRTFAWLLLLSECMVLDISDLLGWKQVFYHFNGLLPPSHYRSSDLNQTYENMRHPGLFELVILLWATPTLSLDRLVCSGLLTIYVVLGFSGQCHAYVARQREKKMQELGYSPSKRVRFVLPNKPDLD